MGSMPFVLAMSVILSSLMLALYSFSGTSSICYSCAVTGGECDVVGIMYGQQVNTTIARERVHGLREATYIRMTEIISFSPQD